MTPVPQCTDVNTHLIHFCDCQILVGYFQSVSLDQSDCLYCLLFTSCDNTQMGLFAPVQTC